MFHFLGFILEPKRSFFSPDLCILITCSSEKCIRINQEVLQALHFFASRAGKCQLFLREDTFFNLDILRGWLETYCLKFKTNPRHNSYNWAHESNIDASSQLGADWNWSHITVTFCIYLSIFNIWILVEMWNVKYRSLCNDFVFTQVSLTRRAMSHFSENTQIRSIQWFLNVGCFPF